MTIAVLADKDQKQEILDRQGSEKHSFVWADSLRSLCVIDADLYIDFKFEMERERIESLKRLGTSKVLVNSVAYTLDRIDEPFIRINGWKTFWNRKITEVAIAKNFDEAKIKSLFDELGWEYKIVPDLPGMITPRIISSIINEAFFALGENVSTKEDIDTAMKLGTNYPYGPFEWCEIIGVRNVYAVLQELGKKETHVSIAPELSRELNRQAYFS